MNLKKTIKIQQTSNKNVTIHVEKLCAFKKLKINKKHKQNTKTKKKLITKSFQSMLPWLYYYDVCIVQCI